MILQINGQNRPWNTIGVQSLGFGQPIPPDLSIKYDAQVSLERISLTTIEEIADIVREGILENDAGLLSPDEVWIAQGWKNGNLGPQILARTDILIKIVMELYFQRFLMKQFHSDLPLSELLFIANSLDYMTITNNTVSFGGRAFRTKKALLAE